MKIKPWLLVCSFFLQAVVHAQMKIGNNATTINSASLLELETTNKGLVFPRVSLTNVSSSSPLPSGLLTGTVVYNTNASVINGSGTGLYFWNGTTWVTVSPNISSTAWSLTGNTGTAYTSNFIGTIDNVGLRFRTNNIERILIDSFGNVGIGSSAFNTLNRERLLVDYGATTSHTLVTLRGNTDNYLQVNLQNQSNGINASTDYVATADDGTDSTYYIDMGINSSTYTRAAHNWGGAHDGYLYVNSKNLLIGTATSYDVIFMANGGAISSNTIMRLKGSNGNVVIGKGDNTTNPSGNILRGPSGNGTDIAGGNLTLQGGSATGTAAGGNLNIYGGSTISGSTGSVNINSNTNSATNINTGSSTSNIIIGNASNNINLPKLSASSVVLTDGSKNLTTTTPSNNTYLYYNGTNFTWATAASSIASLTNGSGIASLSYNGLSAASISLANGTAAGQVYVTGATPFTPSLVAMSGDATISSAGALTLATVNSNVGTFNNVTVNAKGLVTAASNVPYTSLTSFSATLPLTYNNTTGVFAINQATTSANGYLSSTDWNTFNNKVGSISLTTPSTVFGSPVNFSVTSGAATGTLALTTQTANIVFAGPASGAAAVPTFRSLVAADIPSLAGSYIQNQSTQQASSNFNINGSGTIGTNLAVTGTSTLTGAVSSNGGITNTGILTTAGGAVNINAGSNFATNINTGTSTGTVTIGNSLNNINLPKLSASSVVLTDAGKNLTTTTPSSNTYLYYNGTNFAWQGSLAWNLTGNASTTAGTNFIGTTDAIDFVAKTNNTERMRILGAVSGSSQAGWIGMGVTPPRSSLDVAGNYTNKNVLTIQNTSSTGYSSVDMIDNSGTLKGTFGYGNSGTGTFFGSRDYFSTYGSDFVLNANSGSYNFFMNGSSGDIGINTGTPAATLDVNGDFKLGSSGTVLTNMIKGNGSIAAFTASGVGSTTTKTITVTGANTNASVIVNPRAALPAGLAIAYSYVSVANTVTIGFVSTLMSISVPAITYDITVIQ